MWRCEVYTVKVGLYNEKNIRKECTAEKFIQIKNANNTETLNQ